MAKKLITNIPIKINLEPISKLVEVTQGESIIRLTVEQITALKQLRDGKCTFYSSFPKPKNSFKLMKNYNVLVECAENGSTILLVDNDERNDFKVIFDFLESKRGKIARDREFKNR